MVPKRRTYIVSVRDDDGPATVEETRTGRKARISSLKEIGAQIERWLREARAPGRREGDGR
jgi:hypothetical protein